ncbi:hypothetical protein VNI00_004526 [Paramarasmius palmivorus]|uniref:F-box domain-containing protein n=1 Tax=Paramarasmius palmivorus TaxID=297713 RepID=A0AAW0DI15_9AGAR
MHLQDLPLELLSYLPTHLDDIEDFLHVSQTCSRLYLAYAQTLPSIILRLAAASSLPVFQPHPLPLIVATIRGVSVWALGNESNTQTLRIALQGGLESLLELCIRQGGLTFDDIRRIHVAKRTIIDPLARKVRIMSGEEYDEEHELADGPIITFSDAEQASYQLIIYGELFGKCTLDDMPRWFSVAVRLDFVRCCVAGWMRTEDLSNQLWMEIVRGPTLTMSDHMSLRNIISAPHWIHLWTAVTRSIGPDFGARWKQKMWFDMVQLQGLEGMEMLVKGGPEKWQQKLVVLYEKVDKLEESDKPGKQRYSLPGMHGSDMYVDISEAPDLENELRVCILEVTAGH